MTAKKRASGGQKGRARSSGKNRARAAAAETPPVVTSARRTSAFLPANRTAGQPAALDTVANRPAEAACVAVADHSLDQAAHLQNQARLLAVKELLAFSPDGCVITDPHGLIVQANHAAATLFRTRLEFLIGKPLAMFFANHQRHDFYTRLQHPAVGQLERWEVSLPLPPGAARDGFNNPSYRQVLLTRAAYHDPEGRLAGYRWLLHDLTQSRQTEEALREEKNFSDKLLATLPAALLVIDPAGHILRTNSYVELASGHAGGELLGRDWCSVLLFESERELGRKLLFEALRNGTAQSDVLGFLGARGHRHFRWAASKLGSVLTTRIILLGRDVTEIERTQQRLVGILENAPNAILTLDSRGRVDEFNPAAERLFGYTAQEVVGRNVRLLIPAFQSSSTWTTETHGRCKDGSPVPISCSLSEIHEGKEPWFTCIVHDLTPRRELEREILEAAAAEQRRIGEDLHDEVGQELTGLSLLAGNLVQDLTDTASPEANNALKVFAGIKRTLRLVRELCQGLVPVDIDPAGLMSALDDMAARTSDLLGVRCTFEASGGAVLVEDNTVATHLFRIAKESLTNALKHGKAQNIKISLTGQAAVGCLIIQDDGVGLENNSSGGVGLKIMRHRAELIGGKLTVEKHKDGGTMVSCTFAVAGG